jgi:hypothetical protein
LFVLTSSPLRLLTELDRARFLEAMAGAGFITPLKTF